MTAAHVDSELDPDAFQIRRVALPEGVEMAYVHEGVGGRPLLLLHGWPESMRIWWRNIAPLVAAGFEVIVPDLRGFGLTGPVAGGYYDLPAHSADLKSLLDSLGHESCVVAGGDYGGMILQDLDHRFPGIVERSVFFNTLPPMTMDVYEEAGLGGIPLEEVNAVSEHVLRHGKDADGLAAELTTDSQRRSYVAGYFTYRHWAAPAAFNPETVDFMTAPYADADTFRASLTLYEAYFDPDKVSGPGLMDLPIDTRTMILYGVEDKVVGPMFPRRAAVACRNALGPFLIQDAGHFLQFEQAEVFNEAVRTFCGDLLQ